MNAKDSLGMTPLMYACFCCPGRKFEDDKFILESLLEAGALVNDKNASGASALLIASGTAGPEIVSALIASGAKVNGRDDRGATPLMAAAGYNPDGRVLKTLIEKTGL